MIPRLSPSELFDLITGHYYYVANADGQVHCGKVRTPSCSTSFVIYEASELSK
jgi:hypothetical protein